MRLRLQAQKIQIQTSDFKICFPIRTAAPDNGSTSSTTGRHCDANVAISEEQETAMNVADRRLEPNSILSR